MYCTQSTEEAVCCSQGTEEETEGDSEDPVIHADALLESNEPTEDELVRIYFAC